MAKFKILLDSIDKVRDFVNTVKNVESDIDLTNGRCIVDGKSFLGIASMDLSKEITMTINDDRVVTSELLKALDKFLVA